MPPIPYWDHTNKYSISYLGESGGRLHLVQDLYQGSKQANVLDVFNVYEMERDRSGWIARFRVDLNGIVNLPAHWSSIMCVVKEEKEEDSFIVMYTPDVVFRYNFKSQTHQVISELGLL